MSTISQSKTSLQEQLDAARPSALSWDGYSPRWENVDITLREDPGDGIWVPTCGHETQLIHFEGPHPFKYLKCRCDRILNSNDRTSEILTPVQSLTMEISKQRFRDQKDLQESMYCQMCRVCGLTHRGVVTSNHIEFPTMPCVCGETSDKEPMYFYIGDVAAYREDPTRMAVELSIERILAAARRCMSSRVLIADWVSSSARVTDMACQAVEEKRPHRKPHVHQQDIPEGSQPRARAYKSLFVTNPDVEELRRRPSTFG